MTSVVAPSFCRLVAPRKGRGARRAWLVALGGLSLHCGNRDPSEARVPETPRVSTVADVPVVPHSTSSSSPAVSEPLPSGAATGAQLWGERDVFVVIDDDGRRECLSLRFEPRDDAPTKGKLRLYLDRSRYLHYSVEGSEIRFRYLHEYTGAQNVEGVDCRSTSHFESKGGWLLLDGAKLFDSKVACVERASDTQPLPRSPPHKEIYEVASWCWAFL